MNAMGKDCRTTWLVAFIVLWMIGKETSAPPPLSLGCSVIAVLMAAYYRILCSATHQQYKISPYPINDEKDVWWPSAVALGIFGREGINLFSDHR